MVWKVEKGIPHCSACGYVPALKGFTRHCPPVCPECGTRMYDGRDYETNEMKPDDPEFLCRQKIMYYSCCNEFEKVKELKNEQHRE